MTNSSINCQSNLNCVPVYQSVANCRPIQKSNSQCANQMRNMDQSKTIHQSVTHQSFTNRTPILTNLQPIRTDEGRLSNLPHYSSYQPTGTPIQPLKFQSYVNQVPIVHQSEDNCPTNLGTSLLWGPTEVSLRSTIKTINLRSVATPSAHP